MIRLFVAAQVLALSNFGALAEDVSPLFGNEGQEPFRLLATASSEVVVASPIATGSINALPEKGAKPICTIKDCNTKVDAAKAAE